MALHCRCRLCSVSPALGRAFGPAETIVGAALPAGSIGGEFVHYSGAARLSLMSREIFDFPGAGHGAAAVQNVGVSGFYLPPGHVGAVPAGVGIVLALLGVGGAVQHRVPITALNHASIFQTRAGALVAGSELTMLIGCSGSVTVATGAIVVGTLGATRPCVAPAGCCAIM